MIADLVNAVGNLLPEETSAHMLRHTFVRNYLAHYPGDLVLKALLRAGELARHYAHFAR